MVTDCKKISPTTFLRLAPGTKSVACWMFTHRGSLPGPNNGVNLEGDQVNKFLGHFSNCKDHYGVPFSTYCWRFSTLIILFFGFLRCNRLLFDGFRPRLREEREEGGCT